MTLPRMIIELLVTDGLYFRKRLSMLIIVAGFVAIVISCLTIRQQADMNSKQRLKSTQHSTS